MDRTRQRQAIVLAQLLAGRITTQEAAASLGKSVRTIERWRPAFRNRGIAALVHGNVGRTPANATPEDVRESVVEFARAKYAGFNFEHLAEMLEEIEGLQISPRSVHRFCTRAGISSPRPQRRRSRHRKRRERCAREGELLQLDGSPHDWLEGRGPRLTLLTGIDDATSKRWAIFREGEDLQGYMQLLQSIVERHGVPGAIYTDRTVIVAGTSRKYKPFSDEPPGQSQLARALAELGVGIVLANSPQAKGRVERNHGLDQDRLCSELRLAGARTLAEANAVLRIHLRRTNQRFAVLPRDPEPAWRCRPAIDLRDVFCLKEERVVSNDNTVRVYGHLIDIPPGSHNRSYAGRRVLIHRRYDGTLGVFFSGRRIGGTPPKPLTTRPTDSLAS